MFFKSGHVQSLMDCESKNHLYFCRCKCLSSFAPKKTYNVCVSLSKDSGFVKGASCNCKASALGRCNHVAALLFAILDYTKKNMTDQPACTSLLCEWNKGRKEKAPKALHHAAYDSVGSTEAKRRKKEPDETIKFDPRPTSMRSPQSAEHINNFLTSLQSSLNGEKSMWEILIPYKYLDFQVDPEDTVLIENCRQFQKSLIPAQSTATEIVPTQGTEEWYHARTFRITASVSKDVCNKETLSGHQHFNLLKRLLWTDITLNTDAVMYGRQHESMALQDYKKHFHQVKVSTTGKSNM